MIKKISTIALISMLSTFQVNAQNTPHGSANVYLDVEATVPKMCNITTSYFSNVDIGTYRTQQLKSTKYYTFNCKTNSQLTMNISLGSNPHSTSQLRRLPLNGEQGDVEHYLEFYILQSSISPNKRVGGSEDLVIAVDEYGTKKVTLDYVIPKQNRSLPIGDYYDNLEIYVEYW